MSLVECRSSYSCGSVLGAGSGVATVDSGWRHPSCCEMRSEPMRGAARQRPAASRHCGPRNKTLRNMLIILVATGSCHVAEYILITA